MFNWLRGLRRNLGSAILPFLLLALAVTARAQSTFPATPKNLSSTSTTTSSFPSMVVDAKGNINVAWVDSGGGVIFSRSMDGGKTFAANVSIPGSTGATFQPQIVVDATRNTVYVAWAATTIAGTADVLVSVSTGGGAAGSFSMPTKLTALAGATPTPVPLKDGPRMALLPAGGVVVVWGENAAFASQSGDGINFSAPVQISISTAAQDSGGPRVAVNAVTGTIYIAWTDELALETKLPGNYCTNPAGTTDSTGAITVYSNKFGGNVYFNQALKGAPFSSRGTRDLSSSDWVTDHDAKFPLGFYGCSFDNLELLLDQNEAPHLLWSDDQPDEDVLTSKAVTTDSTTGLVSLFSFPINLATLPAGAPDGLIDNTGTIYVVWSGGLTGGTNSEGIVFKRSDDDGSNFAESKIISGAGAIAPSFPKVRVDANGNVNVVWEQEDQTITAVGPNTFHVFFARIANKGQDTPAVTQVSAASSRQCIALQPIPATPVANSCGSVQLGLDSNANADIVWVNQASGAANSDILFSSGTVTGGTRGNLPGSISPNSANLSAANSQATFTVTVNPSGFSGSVSFTCMNADTGGAPPSWLSCNSFNPQPLNLSQGNSTTWTVTRVATPTSGLLISPPSSHSLPAFGRPMAWSMALAALWLIVMAMPATGRHRGSHAAVLMRGFLVMTLTVVLAAGLVSCGGRASSTGTTGTSGSGGSGAGNSVQVHLAVMAQSSTSSTPVNLGTVTIHAQ